MLTQTQIRRAVSAVMVSLRASLAAAGAVSLAGCAMSAASDPKPPVSVEKRREVIQRETSSHTPARVPAADQAVTGEVPAAIMHLFIDDLMLRAAVRRGAIAVTEAVQLDWPDGSLGCAKPGTASIQVITPGYRARLTANGQTYAYHSDLRGHFLLCDSGVPMPPSKRTAGDKPPAQ
jgi:hypothetical protein